MSKMRTLALVLGLFVVLVGGQAFAGPLLKPGSKVPAAQDLIDQAWNSYKADSGAATCKKCYDMLEQANKLDPNNPGILNELARYYWEWADQQPKATKEQQAILVAVYKKAQGYAEQSLKLKETSGGHYWWAVNRSSSLEFASIWDQAKAFPAIKKNSDWVSDHEPTYYYGATGRLWTEILSRVTKAVVKIVGFKYVQDAIDQINLAIKEEPKYLDNYLYKARFTHVYYNNDPEALKLLDYELKQDPNTLPTEVTANKTSQENARELWKKITGKDWPNK